MKRREQTTGGVLCVLVPIRSRPILFISFFTSFVLGKNSWRTAKIIKSLHTHSHRYPPYSLFLKTPSPSKVFEAIFSLSLSRFVIRWVVTWRILGEKNYWLRGGVLIFDFLLSLSLSLFLSLWCVFFFFEKLVIYRFSTLFYKVGGAKMYAI